MLSRRTEEQIAMENIRRKCQDIFQYFVNLKTCKEFDAETLYCAIQTGDYDFVQEILQSGLNPDAVNNLDRAPILHVATEANRVDIVFLLLLFGSDCNVTNGVGETSLHIAARFGFADLVHALTEAGADKGLRTQEGKTALDLAQKAGHSVVIDILRNKDSVDVVTGTLKKRTTSQSH